MSCGSNAVDVVSNTVVGVGKVGNEVGCIGSEVGCIGSEVSGRVDFSSRSISIGAELIGGSEIAA